jgi:type I restriction enzyme S subunit
MKDSGIPWLGEVPAHWDIGRFKDGLRITKNLVGANSASYTLLSLTLQGVIPRDLDNPHGKFPAEFDTYQAVQAGDLIFCLFDVEETPRAVGYSTYDGMVTGAYTVCSSVKPFDAKFFFYFYLARDQYKAFKCYYTGLRNVIRKELFMSIPCAIPSEEEQAQIVEFIESELAKIDLLQVESAQAIALLEERRIALIAAAVTGKVDVRDLVEKVAA